MLLLMIAWIALTEFAPTEFYKPDNWATISIAIGATILTLVGIITSILVSNENNRRVEFIANLSLISNKIEQKAGTNPDKSLNEIYSNSIEKLRALVEGLAPLKYSEGLIGIFSFFFFLISALLAIFGYQFKFVIGNFVVGTVLLIGYVIYIIEEFIKIDVSSSLPKKNGKLTLLAIKLNGEPWQFENKNENEVSIKLNQIINRIEFKVRFEGEVRNAFLHATVRYANGLVSYIPDANTYLSNFGFINDFRLGLLESVFDTGTLQSDKQVDLSLDLVLRSEKGTAQNPVIAKGFIERLGEKDIYKYCSIPEDFHIDSIEIRIWEDPFFKPNYKRREVDLITVRPQRI